MSGRTAIYSAVLPKSNAVKIYPDNDKRTQFIRMYKNVYIIYICFWTRLHCDICYVSNFIQNILRYIVQTIFMMRSFRKTYSHSNSITISTIIQIMQRCRITLHQNDNFYSIWKRNYLAGALSDDGRYFVHSRKDRV